MIPLVAPTITPADRGAMLAAVSDGTLFDETTVSRFEEAFAAYVGCEWAVAVNSGTNALVVALSARGRLKDLTVPSYSCVAIRNAVVKANYADGAFDVCSAQFTTAETDVAVHMFGRPNRLRGIPMVADWTLSLGAEIVNKVAIGVCSTHSSKMFSTGRGGVIFGWNDSDHERVRYLVDYEQHHNVAFSVAMSSMQATLGLSQLRQLPRFIDRRRELANRYTSRFRPAGIDCPDADCGSVFFRYLISVTDPAGKVKMLAERGIEAGRGVYPPLHQLAGLPDADFPGTMAAVNSLLSVPVHPSITDKQADHIIESVLKVCAP